MSHFYRQYTSAELLDKLMEAVEEKDTAAAVRQNGRSGIAVAKDTQARRWQRCEQRINSLYRELRRRIEASEKASAAVSDFNDELRRMGV